MPISRPPAFNSLVLIFEESFFVKELGTWLPKRRNVGGVGSAKAACRRMAIKGIIVSKVRLDYIVSVLPAMASARSL